MIDLASRALGGSVLAASDEFFANKENLIKPEPPVFRPQTFTAKGQEYDGWETRRRRDPGHDWVIIRLGAPGIIRRITVDTTHFTGNHPQECSVEATTDLDSWTALVPCVALRGDSANEFTVDTRARFSHVRLTIHPDGGVARLRVHGEALLDPDDLADVPVDLAALRNGGFVVSCSDSHFSPPNNMLQPGESRYMSDGWETRRRRGPGHDWAVIRLAAQAIPRVADLATTHYLGNAPHHAILSGIDATTAALDDPAAWFPLLRAATLHPDTTHRLRLTPDAPPTTHVRLEIHPDGGVARFRLYGPITPTGLRTLSDRWEPR